MAYASYSIRRLGDHSEVPLEDIDRIVRTKLSLKDHGTDKPYGHFYFTESPEELIGFQESISWAGLIHVIVYYSSIDYGERSKYDIEAAMAWIKIHAIHFPNSAIVFTSKLLNVLESLGCYIFVNFRRDDRPDRDQHEYVNLYSFNRIYTSESGLFECSDEGKLLNFYPSKENLMNETRVRETYYFGKSYYSPCVKTLIIPEGVRSISHDFFRGGWIDEYVQFPRTTQVIDDFAFSETMLPDVVIPKSVNAIGTSAFCGSQIRKLIFEGAINSDYMRQFKDSRINELVIPRCMWDRDDLSRNFKIHCDIQNIILT